MNNKTAIVFAYHDVGVRCLKVLINAGIDIKLVVTHLDSPSEKIWFASVSKVAKEYGIPVITPDNPNTAECISQFKSIAPDFIFSFYYRMMLKPEVLETAKKNAFNMHGSLLPKYRGRVPLNWAIIKGESEAGATLHIMTPKPDAGEIVDQMAIPILLNDTAQEVFQKMVTASEIVLYKSIEKIAQSNFSLMTNNLKEGSYFSGRKPEDGKIDPQKMSSREIHDLIRAVAPPFPGAFLQLSTESSKFFIYRSLFRPNMVFNDPKLFVGRPILYRDGEKLFIQKEKMVRIEILECAFENESVKSSSEFIKSYHMNQTWEIL